MTKLIVAFRNFAKAPNKENNISYTQFFLCGNKVLLVTVNEVGKIGNKA